MDLNEILILAKKIPLPSKDIDTIIEYLDHQEWGIAFEVLCSAIECDKLSISNKDYMLIREMGEYMDIDKDLWESFKV